MLDEKWRGWRGGGKKGTPPSASRRGGVNDAAAAKGGTRPGTMESASLLAGDVQRLQFLKKKTGVSRAVGELCKRWSFQRSLYNGWKYVLRMMYEYSYHK